MVLPIKHLTVFFALATAATAAAVPAVVTTVPGSAGTLDCQRTWCQDGISMCLYWAGITGWDVSHGPVPGMTQTTFEQPCVATATANPDIVNLSANPDRASGGYEQIRTVTKTADPVTIFATATVTALHGGDQDEDTEEAEISVPTECEPTYCEKGTQYCHYLAGFTGWDVSLGPVPGMTRTAIGTCGDDSEGSSTALLGE